MRTTIDIDPRVLAVARSRVHAGQNKTLGEAVSELALAGLTTGTPREASSNGLVLLTTEAGHVITDEMVAEALLDE